tara:strand:- start:224 stop:475 length:252 start_codon:yes stop_codon:yes gene_type:complete
MKILLIIFALLFFPLLNAKSESVWLLLLYNSITSQGASAAFEKIEMKNLDQCEEQGQIYLDSKKIPRKWGNHPFKAYECIIGK